MFVHVKSCKDACLSIDNAQQATLPCQAHGCCKGWKSSSRYLMRGFPAYKVPEYIFWKLRRHLVVHFRNFTNSTEKRKLWFQDIQSIHYWTHAGRLHANLKFWLQRRCGPPVASMKSGSENVGSALGIYLASTARICPSSSPAGDSVLKPKGWYAASTTSSHVSHEDYSSCLKVMQLVAGNYWLHGLAHTLWRLSMHWNLSYLCVFFHEISQHHDEGTLLHPYHLPKVTYSVKQGPLARILSVRQPIIRILDMLVPVDYRGF